MLHHGEFEINGHRFGCHHPVKVVGFRSKGINWRVQDQPNPVGDGMRFGIDYADPEDLHLELSISDSTAEEVRSAFTEFSHAWADASRHTSGDLAVLRYGIHGTTRRVYGRPRALDVDEGAMWAQKVAQGTASFARSSHLFFDDQAQQSERLTLHASETGGLVFPIVFPWGTLPGGPRRGQVHVGGTIPAPATVLIHGPVTDPVVESGGWQVGFTGMRLAYDQSATVDALSGTVLRNDGASLAGKLTRNTFLADVRMRPGAQEITYQGDDPTGTSWAEVSWHPATTSI